MPPFLSNGNATFHAATFFEDWCHLCGLRTTPLVEVVYPKNAEHGGPKTEYIRICWDCIGVMQKTLQLANPKGPKNERCNEPKH